MTATTSDIQTGQAKTSKARRIVQRATTRLSRLLVDLGAVTPAEAVAPAIDDATARALGAIVEVGTMQNVTYYAGPRPRPLDSIQLRADVDTVVHFHGLFGVTSLPEEDVLRLRAAGLLSTAGVVTPCGHAALQAHAEAC